MSVIAIVGAEADLARAVAEQFGGHGFHVALVGQGLDELAVNLSGNGTHATAFPCVIADGAALTATMTDAVTALGAIDVLVFSNRDVLPTTTAMEARPENLRPELDRHFYAGVTATNAILPPMLESGSGTLFFVISGAAIHPDPAFAGSSAAQAALRNWTLGLAQELKPVGVAATAVVIDAYLGTQPPAPGIDFLSPTHLAEKLWAHHTGDPRAEVVLTGSK
ncbi:SDR family NAD(P)-dependent oxidoreductase [Nocardia camponoti]|uniref:SDR family NAD(P)-dependent oxidoreductase n=1 Tax=Nocardia camponoti TaxID=1616106 RepID=A0A917VDQ8_9NOCA|nr:SDR family NAD(P)-dependent oxidoreductase [Nocardia camponoti]GGK67709.1 hypothetical protein GCM10011591_44850 [Nocardia camponoti]